ncbi:MAG TPA: hypothetical protein VLH40_03925 [Atribacteraceae bacterium]|nr:hypothetical protein [Atribacteraceae bacterium]
MAFVRGKALLPENTPLVQKNPWEYISVIYKDNRKESMIPLVDARVEVFLPISRDVVSRGLTSDDGGFFVRVPAGERYFLEISLAGKLILLGYISVDDEIETDIGVLDSLTTSYALYMLRKVFQGETTDQEADFDAEDFHTLRHNVEECWKAGQGLESLAEYHRFAKCAPSCLATLDPSGLLRAFHCAPDRLGKQLTCEWESREPGGVALCYRSFRSRHFRRKWSDPNQTRGWLMVPTPGEFEGYLYFLEFQSQQGFLGRTPLYVWRTPLQPLSRTSVLIGRQEGPAIVSRAEKSGEQRIPGTVRPFNLRLHQALEKRFEAEIDLTFSRKIRVPRYLVREGFQDLELNIYLPQEHSFLWGPVNESPGVELVRFSLKALAKEWRVIPVEILPESIVEIGFSTPFAELVAYREGESYRLFSDLDLQSPVTILSFRKIDSLGLESIIYYRGRLSMRGEGLFEGFRMNVAFEGKFEEDGEEGFFPGVPGEITGNVEYRLDYRIEPGGTE